MIAFHFILLFIEFDMGSCVPPIPAATSTTTTERPDPPKNMIGEELKQIKSTMKTLSDHLGKWNYMYISQLEPRITASATTLVSIDSNIQNLQERAHVWDTFQLHVAAWNEQLSTSDRKLDIISKAQEEIMVLEGKINSYSNIEYKIEKMFKKLEDFEEQLSNLNTKLENSGQLRDSLFGEFATRGILSTLKSVERKLDKMQLTNQNLNAKLTVDKNSDETKGKLTIKCNTPPVVEELLHDMAAKVDVIFDKLNGIDDVEELAQEDYLEDQNYSSENMNTKTDPDAKLINKLWKKLKQPCKQANKLLEHLISTVYVVNNNTLAILENENNFYENYRTGSLADLKPFMVDLYKNILDKIDVDVKQSSENHTRALENHFVEYKTYVNEIMKLYLENEYRHSDKHREKVNDSTLILPSESQHPRSTNNLCCDDIQFGEPNGIYRLGYNAEFANSNNELYYTRYCDIRKDGSWTVIQNRDNYETLQNFTLDWYNYKMGFGKLHADFWVGNDFIYKLSHEDDLILRIELDDFEGNSAWAEYEHFQIASEYENYRLTIGAYRGNASDSLSSHNNSLFSTYDVKNDEAPDCCPCAESYGGGWWFNSCFESNLNGVYHRSPHSNAYFRGIIWEHWLGNYSLKKTKMLVRKSKAGNEDRNDTTTNNYEFLEDP